MPGKSWGGLCPLALIGGLFVGVGCDPGEAASGESAEAAPEVALSSLQRSGPTPIPEALTPPTIDGRRDAQYQLGPARPIARVVRGTKPVASDLVAKFHALHDTRNLYVFVEVVDDRVVLDDYGRIPWEDDAVEIFLDGDERPSSRYDGVDDVQIVFRPRDPSLHLGVRSAPVRPSSIRFNTLRTDTGYQVEVAIPWWAVGAAWRKDRVFGLDVHVDDDDDGGTRDHKLTWSSVDDTAWHRPDRFGRVRLSTDIGPGFFASIGDLPGGAFRSSVKDLSDSGEVLVGESEGAGGTEGFRFTMKRGMVGFGPETSATAVSANGMLVAGYFGSGNGSDTGALWRGTMVQLMDGPILPPHLPPVRMMWPAVVLNDGRVYGNCNHQQSHVEPTCRWDGPGQITLLREYGVITAADALGNVGGWEDERAATPPCVTAIACPGEGIEQDAVGVLNGYRLGYPPKAPCKQSWNCQSYMYDFSSGAEVLVGTNIVPNDGDRSPTPVRPTTAFVFRRGQGMMRLPDLAGGDLKCEARSVSRDGRVIGGYGADARGTHAVVWVHDKPRILADLARARGVVIPADFHLDSVVGISADGRTFAGGGYNARGEYEGFLLSLAQAP